jgi:RNA polymerase sigma factor (TIGR02999 family)
MSANMGLDQVAMHMAREQAIVAPPLRELVPGVYRELRTIAHRQLARRLATGGRSRTIETTALVHEAYLRLVRAPAGGWRDRSHFLAIAALAMRQVLIERARRRKRRKRGSGASVVPLEDEMLPISCPDSSSTLELTDALHWLAHIDRRLARVVACRLVAGMSEQEIAAAFGVTVRTVQRDWSKARMLLRRALT